MHIRFHTCKNFLSINLNFLLYVFWYLNYLIIENYEIFTLKFYKFLDLECKIYSKWQKNYYCHQFHIFIIHVWNNQNSSQKYAYNLIWFLIYYIMLYNVYFLHSFLFIQYYCRYFLIYENLKFNYLKLWYICILFFKFLDLTCKMTKRFLLLSISHLYYICLK